MVVLAVIFFIILQTFVMRNSIHSMTVLSFFALLLLTACRKEAGRNPSTTESELIAEKQHGHLNQTKTFSSEVGLKWQDMQLRILRLPAGVNPYGLNGIRNFAYCGI